jgi:TrmH family RNA methyltransferase
MTETSQENPITGREALDGIVVVLWQTQDRVNVAGTIRAMKNFGLKQLRLVAPAEWDPWRIEGIAHDTADLIEATRIFDTLEEAVADCAFVVGMTARSRRAKRAVARPRELVPELLERGADAVRGAAGPVAVLFGREDRGLSNEALDLCHRTVMIPTNPDYSSLNLAQAVLAMAYELWMEAEGRTQPFRDPRHVSPPATVEHLELLFADTERALWAVDFFKSRQTETVMRTLREVARRAELDTREATFLRAMAIEVQKFVRRHIGEGGEGPGGGAPPAGE